MTIAEGSPAAPASTLALFPLLFTTHNSSAGAAIYLADPAARLLLEFFEKKGLPALKDEDRRELWYEDFLAYQTRHQLYARLLTPREFSPGADGLNLLRLTRFLELFAWCSAAHGYSLQVTFLGLAAILSGTNQDLKHEALAALRSGGLLAFGISEKAHGADLLSTEFAITPAPDNCFLASGSKYYIGNANCASLIAILTRKENPARANATSHRAPIALIALRPKQSPAYKNVRKIPALGIRSAFVGSFEVQNHLLPQSDVVAEGRDAWNCIFGAVTLGKFFLGFGSIGICERALHEAVTHLSGRILYHKAAIQMPHLQSAVAQAYARLIAMKLYAYRALDYVLTASEQDRRYLLFNAVQKARVSTEGVKVVALLADSIGAKAFESESYFEMALRDIQLIPNLEGSSHINLNLAAQLIPQYFAVAPASIPIPPSHFANPALPAENPYLLRAATAPLTTIAFADAFAPYQALGHIPNVVLFTQQIRAFQKFLADSPSTTESTLAVQLGSLFAIIAYAQLIAEHAALLTLPAPVISTIFHCLITDLSTAALTLASSSDLAPAPKTKLQSLIVVPATTAGDWNFLTQRLSPLATPSLDPTP